MGFWAWRRDAEQRMAAWPCTCSLSEDKRASCLVGAGGASTGSVVYQSFPLVHGPGWGSHGGASRGFAQNDHHSKPSNRRHEHSSPPPPPNTHTSPPCAAALVACVASPTQTTPHPSIPLTHLLPPLHHPTQPQASFKFPWRPHHHPSASPFSSSSSSSPAPAPASRCWASRGRSNQCLRQPRPKELSSARTAPRRSPWSR